MILFEGPESIAAVFVEPLQNSGGCFPPPPGYLQRVRDICTQYALPPIFPAHISRAYFCHVRCIMSRAGSSQLSLAGTA